MKISKGMILSIIGGLATILVANSNIAINDAGYRTVVQYPSGGMAVKFTPGLHFPFFGKTTVYPDFLSFDFSAGEDNVCSFASNDGVKVRYQDGGEGVVCGMANVQLPVSEEEMIAFHKRYRSTEGVRTKLLNQTFPKSLNLTAALMTSEEAYATKRSEYIEKAEYQAKNGLYMTKLVVKKVQVGIDENGEPEIQEREVPDVQYKDGTALTQGSDFAEWGVSVTQFDLKAWDFESKTLNQISDKRAAEMAIITAKSNAKKAYYAEQQVIAEGKKNVAQAEYQAKVKAEQQIQEAERDKQLALIEATKAKEKAELLTEAAFEATNQKRQEVLQATEEAKSIKILADANAYKIEKEQLAGELKLRLDNSVQIAAKYADAIAQMNVPSTMIIGSGGSSDGSSELQQLLQLQVLDKVKTITPQVK